MQIKTAIKAVAATAVGALMLGATIAGTAMAVDLGSFPEPFVKDGAMKAKLVMGSGGTSREGLAQDLTGALQVAAALGQATIQEVEAEGAGSVELLIEGVRGKSAEVAIGESANTATNLGSSLGTIDLPMLFDGKVYDDEGDDYNMREKVTLTAGIAPFFDTDDDGRDIKVEVNNADLQYVMSITDSIPILSSSNKLYLPILGLDHTLMEWGNGTGPLAADGKYLKFERGTTKLLSTGDSTTYGDYTVKLDNVDTSASTARVSVSVTGSGCSESKIISQATSTDQPKKSFCGGDMQIQLMSAISGAAELSIGEKVVTTVVDGDSEWFSNKDYAVTIAFAGTDLDQPTLTLSYEPETELVGTDALKIGDSINFLYDAFQLEPKELTASEHTTFKFSKANAKICDLATTDMLSTASAGVIKVEWPADAGVDMRVFGKELGQIDHSSSATTASDTSAKELYIGYIDTMNVSITYKDNAGSMKCAGIYMINHDVGVQEEVVAAAARYGDAVYQLYLDETAANGVWDGYIELRSSMFEDSFSKGWEAVNVLTRVVAGEFDGLAATKGTAAAGDLELYTITAGGVYTLVDDVSAEEKNYIDNFGVTVKTPKTKLESSSGSMELSVPNTQDKVSMFIGTEEPETKSLKPGESYEGITVNAINVEGAKMATVTPISVPVAAVDTEITDKTETNLILFGGPVVNTLVEELGYTAADFGSADAPLGKLMLKSAAFGGSNYALVVAGWEAENTQAACWVLAHYFDYADELEGKSDVSVTGTGITSLQVA